MWLTKVRKQCRNLSVQTALRELSLVKQTLPNVRISYKENARYTHIFSGFRGEVPLLIKRHTWSLVYVPLTEIAMK